MTLRDLLTMLDFDASESLMDPEWLDADIAVAEFNSHRHQLVQSVDLAVEVNGRRIIVNRCSIGGRQAL